MFVVGTLSDIYIHARALVLPPDGYKIAQDGEGQDQQEAQALGRQLLGQLEQFHPTGE